MPTQAVNPILSQHLQLGQISKWEMIHEDQLLKKNLILHSTNDSHYLANSIRHIFG